MKKAPKKLVRWVGIAKGVPVIEGHYDEHCLLDEPAVRFTALYLNAKEASKRHRQFARVELVVGKARWEP
jgi:hypothetical protein